MLYQVGNEQAFILGVGDKWLHWLDGHYQVNFFLNSLIIILYLFKKYFKSLTLILFSWMTHMIYLFRNKSTWKIIFVNCFGSRFEESVTPSRVINPCYFWLEVLRLKDRWALFVRFLSQTAFSLSVAHSAKGKKSPWW